MDGQAVLGIYNTLQQVQRDVREHALLLAALTRDVTENTRLTETLSRILRDGNGRQSLLERMSLVEQALSRTAEGMVEIRRLLESSHTEDSRGRWTLANTVVTGILALIAALGTALVTFLTRKGP